MRPIKSRLSSLGSAWLRGYGEDPIHLACPSALRWLSKSPFLSTNKRLRLASTLRLLRSPSTPPFPEEQSLYESVLEKVSSNEKALQGLFLIALTRKEQECCKDLAQRLTVAHPKSVWGWEALGWVYSSEGDWAKAEEAYRSGLELNPENSRLLTGLSLVLDHGGKSAESTEALNRIPQGSFEALVAKFLKGTSSGLLPAYLSEAGDCLNSIFDRVNLEKDAILPDAPPTPCPVCGSQSVRPVHWIESLNKSVGYCEACDLYQVNPQPEVGFEERYFVEDYLGGTYRKIADWVRTSAGSTDEKYGPHRSLLEWLESSPSIRLDDHLMGRALDVGCASGAMVAILNRRGWKTIGVEPSTGLFNLAAGNGLDIRNSNLSAQQFETNRFDLITCLHVLSHARDPHLLLDEIARIQKPGGILILATPVAACLRHFLEGANHFHQPEHLFFFTAKNICSFLTDRGYEVIDFRTPEDPIHEFAETRQGKLPWHPLLVKRMTDWKAGSFLEVAAKKG
ncbi:MAG: methyltransferase domain-containing protein [Candidatus Omnitrophica bacterium]|nr:methyltransferase domain-containing protein [Candidatus Omnitrophota bacterium]